MYCIASLSKPVAVGCMLTAAILATGCSKNENSLEVTATAYTSSPDETDSTPDLAAWGDRLKPGMKAIAVSRDLLPMGLTHRKEVNISGLEGTYLVLDKMNKRWTKKIDIYMGNDKGSAIEWGKKKVTITWTDDE